MDLAASVQSAGCPVIVNTSFNLSWGPIVNQPQEAYRTFMSSDVDALVLENHLLLKPEQAANREARMRTTNGEADRRLASLWSCPSCGGEMAARDHRARCAGCCQEFKEEEGIWQLFWPPTRRPRATSPSSSLRGASVPGLRRGGVAGLAAQQVAQADLLAAAREQIGHNTRVLDVGCGTGQLTNFLGMGTRTVIGSDLCMNSLKLADSAATRACRGYASSR